MKMKVTQRKITVDHWIHSVKDNPRQRDTVSRAAKAEHLKSFDPTHLSVNMATLPNGDEYKCDAHTRAFIWKNDPELKNQIPDQELYATVYEAKTLDEIVALYERFDSQEAVEKTAEKLFGSMRHYGFSPNSSFVRKSKFVVAVKLANSYWNNAAKRENNVDEDTKNFIQEIRYLDALMLNNKGSKTKMLTPAVICYLLAQKKHGSNPNLRESIDRFFTLHKEDSGNKEGKDMDYVYLFSKAIKEYNDKGDRSTRSAYETAGLGLGCIENWLKNPHKKVKYSKSIDPKEYADH